MKLKEAFLKALETIGQIASEAIVYVFVACVSFGLGHMVHWMEANGGSALFIWMASFCEYAMFALDIYAILKRVWTHINH